MDFNWRPDPTELLAVKSMIGGLTTWTSEFDSSYHGERYGTGCHQHKGDINKRVLLEHMWMCDQ